MPEEHYPKSGSYRLLMNNPPPRPGPSTKFVTSNGIGMQVTAEGSGRDEDDRLRQRWYVDLNEDGTGVKFYKQKPGLVSGPGLVLENVNSVNCVFLVDKDVKQWRLKCVNDAEPRKNDSDFYIYSSDMVAYLAIQDYGVVVKTGDPRKNNEYWRFVAARN